jgi:hypothetical protein
MTSLLKTRTQNLLVGEEEEAMSKVICMFNETIVRNISELENLLLK